MGRPGNLQRILPDRLPPDFVKRTISRLMPPPEEISLLKRDELIKLLERKQELEQLIQEDPVRFFHPTSTGQQRTFMTNAEPSVQGLYFFAANKTGKTTGGAIACAEFSQGRPLWESEERASIHNPWLTSRPKRLCFFSEDFSTHAETILPTFVTWAKKYVRQIIKGPSGNISHCLMKNGSIIYLRTYDQGYEKAEGKDYDLVWCDEPPSRDLYTAIFRGLVATRGRLLITATLLSQTWLYDEALQPFVRIYESTIYDNEWLDPIGRDNFVSSLYEDERSIRVYGKPASLSNLIYPWFKNDFPFIVEQQEPPWNPLTEKPWPVVLGVDPHERKPVYCAWAYITPSDDLLWFDWDLVPSDSISAVFERIKKREATHKSPTNLVIIDPNRAVARQIDGKTWVNAFQEHDYDVRLGNDDLSHGHFVVREMLRYEFTPDSHGKQIITNPPRMQFMESLRGKGGPVFQLERYTWEDWARGRRTEKPLKEKPIEKNKDFPDIIRYCATELYDGAISHDSLVHGDEVVSMIGENFQGIGNPYLR